MPSREILEAILTDKGSTEVEKAEALAAMEPPELEPIADEKESFGERDRQLLEEILKSKGEAKAAAIARLERRWQVRFGDVKEEYFCHLLKHSIRLFKADFERLSSSWSDEQKQARQVSRETLTGLQKLVYEMALIESSADPDIVREALAEIQERTDSEFSPVVDHFLRAVAPDKDTERIDLPTAKREAAGFLAAVMAVAK